MARKVSDIEGIGPVYEEKLNAVGIKTVEALLEKACTPKGRKELAEATGISGALVLKWANMADLFRIKGVASQFAELLKASGVDTVKELKHRRPENLHQKLIEVNEQKKLVRVVPALSMLSDFIEQAKEIEPKMSY